VLEDLGEARGTAIADHFTAATSVSLLGRNDLQWSKDDEGEYPSRAMDAPSGALVEIENSKGNYRMALVVPADEKGSLIAFLYRIRFDAEFREAFKKTGRLPDMETPKPQNELPTPNPVVDLFALTDREKQLIDELHDYSDYQKKSPSRAQKWSELLSYAYKEVYTWTYVEYSVW
jgi:hypothetical protein